jgi:hypothetical protein
MKRSLPLIYATWISLALGLAPARAGETRPVLYEVAYRGAVVATQTVSIVESAGKTTLTTSFEADLPVFTSLQHYSEKLSATFRADGTVESLSSFRRDAPPLPTEVTGELGKNGQLRVVRSDMDGIATNFIARADYDFNSLVLYGTAPSDFLPTNHPARVLSVAEGRVVPIAIRTISETETFERQNLVSTHLVWTEGALVSHSWHPERFSHLPRRYIRQTENGEFTFTLLR